jgi:hypothetical protein
MQVLFAIEPRLTLDGMSLPTLSRVRRHRPHTPLDLNRLRIQLSADLITALRVVEGRQHTSLDDLEWADAVAALLVTRLAARLSPNCQAACASTATTPRRKPSTARRAFARTGSSATSAS